MRIPHRISIPLLLAVAASFFLMPHYLQAQTNITTNTTISSATGLGDISISNAALLTMQPGVSTASSVTIYDGSLLSIEPGAIFNAGAVRSLSYAPGNIAVRGTLAATSIMLDNQGASQSLQVWDGGFLKVGAMSGLGDVVSNNGMFQAIQDNPDWISVRYMTGTTYTFDTQTFNVGIKSRLTLLQLYKIGTGTLTIDKAPGELYGGLDSNQGYIRVAQGKLILPLQPRPLVGHNPAVTYSVEGFSGLAELVLTGGDGVIKTCSIGSAVGSVAALRMEGGSLTVASMDVGFNGTADFTLNGGVVNTGIVYQGLGGSGIATVTLNGGILNLAQARRYSIGSKIVFNGGTLGATQANTPLLLGFAAGSAVIQAGGLIIDTQGRQGIGVGAELTGVGGLRKIGAGTLALSSTTAYTGSTSVEAGTFSVEATGIIQSPAAPLNVRETSGGLAAAELKGTTAFSDILVAFPPGSAGTLTITSGTCTSGSVQAGSEGTGAVNVNGGLLKTGMVILGHDGGTANLTLNGGVLETTEVQRWSLSSTLTGNGGTLRAAADSSTFLNGFTSGSAIVGAGGLTLDTNGFTVTVPAELTGGGSLIKTGPGTLTLSGALGHTGELQASQGTLVLSGSTASSTLRVEGSSTPVFSISGGTTNAADAVVARNAGTTGLLKVESGTCNVASLEAGSSGTGTLMINGGLASIGQVVLGHDGGTGSLVLNGGTLSTVEIARWSVASGITFNGGVLRAAGNTSILLNGFNVGSAVIQAGGLTIDTQGFTVATAAELTGSGPLAKTGTGTLSLSGTSTYSGRTTVNAGTLSIANPCLADTSSVSVATDAVLNLAFTGTDTVGDLTLAGVTYTSGTWGAIGSGAQHETALITGPGRLRLSEVGQWLAANGLPGSTAAGDEDQDGIPNLLEYFNGSHPAQRNTVTHLITKGQNQLTFAFDRRKNLVGVTYAVEWSDDLVTWHADNISAPAVQADQGTSERVQVDVTPPGTPSRVFVRIRVLTP